MSVEIVVGAIGALGSLTAVVLKTLFRNSEESEEVTVTVQRGDERIEKHGVMRAGDASKVLDMVRDQSHAKVAAK